MALLDYSKMANKQTLERSIGSFREIMRSIPRSHLKAGYLLNPLSHHDADRAKVESKLYDAVQEEVSKRHGTSDIISKNGGLNLFNYVAMGDILGPHGLRIATPADIAKIQKRRHTNSDSRIGLYGVMHPALVLKKDPTPFENYKYSDPEMRGFLKEEKRLGKKLISDLRNYSSKPGSFMIPLSNLSITKDSKSPSGISLEILSGHQVFELPQKSWFPYHNKDTDELTGIPKDNGGLCDRAYNIDHIKLNSIYGTNLDDRKIGVWTYNRTYPDISLTQCSNFGEANSPEHEGLLLIEEKRKGK